ncbi:MAG: DUF4867 family protein [Lachnospiraceae bacterium]|nr:DUF4867 family protein [Lachnospiraceae bacterium]
MTVHKVTDEAFKKYGKVITSLELTDIVKEMESTPLPEDVVYVPSVTELEKLPIYEALQTMSYGELPIQIGYCNGHNNKLNALEYHRSSEINIAATDLILLLGMQQDITDDYTYDTAKVEAFLLPAGTAVEVYATTLHYAPCSVEGNGFRCVVVLPKDTNLPLDKSHGASAEDKLITAKNKWLIAHKESGIEGDVHFGLVGENITV